MIDDRKLIACSRLIAKVIFAGSVFLCSVGNAFADASLDTSSAFAAADSARDIPAIASPYMDSGGTWNGLAEVTDGTGDSFGFTIANTAPGLPLPIDDTAFDLAVSIDVASGFRLPMQPLPVFVTSACPIFAVTATQPGGVGSPISLNIPLNTNILPGCSYTFTLGLTTDNNAPFVADGFYDVDFNVTYYADDNDSNTEVALPPQTETVEVRTGEIAILKTAVTPIAGDGDLVEFTVSMLGAGSGGIFDVELTDVLSSDLTGLVLVPPASPPGTPGPGANQFTFDYIAEGEIVDVTIQATVAVDPGAATCPVLQNDASAIERTGSTSTFFDTIPFNLQNPFIDYTPPDINVPFGAAGIDVTIPVTNTGTGVAKNVSIAAANITAGYIIVVDGGLSPNWSYAGGGVFNYAGTIAAGVTQNIVFNVSANTCPPPANEDLVWVPSYQNACGTDFFPPIRFSTIAVTNTPDVNVTKTNSAGALNIGQAGTYTIAMGGTNVANLPLGAPPNQDFIVTDTLPFGVRNAVINTIPAGTEVLVNAAPYIAGNVIPELADIVWRGDRADLIPLPSLQIDYVAGSSLGCPVGQTITNTATVDYAQCGINNSDSAGFILSESPAGGAITNIVVGGDGNFEAGAPDTDGNLTRNEPREGEVIPFTVSYSFPLLPAPFPGTWSGTSFTADLRDSAATGVPLVLVNNGNNVNLQITRISDGASICNLNLNPAADFTGGDGTGPLVISDLGAITGCVLPANMADHDMVLTYWATSPEGGPSIVNPANPANDDNVGGYLESTILTVNNGPASCLGPLNTDFIQAINVNIERATLDLTATINNGNPISVCEVVPARLNITGPALDTTSDNIRLLFNDANFEFLDDGIPLPFGAGDENADITYGGSIAALAMSGLRVANDAGNVNGIGDDIIMTPALNTSTVTADGTVNFNVRLRDSALPQTMAAQLDYDSNHTSPTGGATENDRDYRIAVNGSPFAVLSGDLKMEFFPPAIILLDSTTYNFRIQIENVGTGTAVNAVYRMTLPAGMRFDSAIPAQTTAGTFDFSGQTIEWDLGDMPAGSVIDIDISASINQTTCFQGPGEEIVSVNEWGCGIPITNSAPQPPLVLAPTQLRLRHDPNNSFCELCNEGEVRLLASNTGGVLLTSVNVTENLMASGLTYVAGSTTYRVDGAAAVPAAVDPVPFGANGEFVTWTPANIPELANLYSAFNTDAGTPQEVEIIFRVRRKTELLGINEEDLVSAIRNIEATATYGLFCDQFSATPVVLNATSNIFELPIEQPVTDVIKQARNIDARQPVSRYAGTVFGGTSDDIIWRVNVTNNSSQSLADLEDLLINDTIGGNFNISQICNNETNATAAANGAAADGTNCIANAGLSASRNIADPFGNPSNDEFGGAFVDITQGGETFIYFVGTIANTCTNHTNTTGIEYGCQADSPPQGGITTPATNGGVLPTFSVGDTAELSTAVNPAGVNISQSITGSNSVQDLGSKGILTITINNRSGGTVRNITFNDTLPAGYTLDKSLMDATVMPAFAAYDGMIDTITLTNDAALPENNTIPAFSLTSTPVPGLGVNQDNVLRHGDVLIITLGLIRNADFDIVADPVVRTENSGDGTDPTYNLTESNVLRVIFENTCNVAFPQVTDTDNSVAVNPEDLDIDIDTIPTSSDLIFIISDPVPLDLIVSLTNNGGHDASDYFALVAVGDGLQLSSGIPSGCGVTALPREVWPPAIPASSVLYQCSTRDPLGPGETDTFTFSVLANVGGTDLTFRADVVGEITQADIASTPLTFPAPDTGVVNNVANNYSIDSIRARLIGFGLSKVLQGPCSENNLVPTDVQIGEDCTYRMQASWFGFATPGFDSIQVQNVTLTDIVPAGQGFISQDSVASSVSNVVSTPAAPAALATGNIDWTFDPISTDETFSVALVTRSLNDPLNLSTGGPNIQDAVRTDTLDATFDVSFEVAPGVFIVDSFDSSTLGFPRLVDRQANITITEPNLIVTKTVCNETNSGGAGPTCGSFATSLTDGDTNDDYVYRIRILNEASGAISPRAPAFNVEVVDLLNDPDGLLTVTTLVGIDIDSDSVIDSPLVATIVGSPQEVTISHTGNADLERIDPGETIDLYYRVDVADSVSPGQILSNSAVTSYDTLAGASGSQIPPECDSNTRWCTSIC